MQNNNSYLDNRAHFERSLREKFSRCKGNVIPPVGIWKKILDKVMQAMETGEWPDDLDDEEAYKCGDSVKLLDDAKVIWRRNGSTQV